ncbi:MAG: hypothetical protein ACOC5F_03980 [Candidatus Aminicenantaceae bacterium]
MSSFKYTVYGQIKMLSYRAVLASDEKIDMEKKTRDHLKSLGYIK